VRLSELNSVRYILADWNSKGKVCGFRYWKSKLGIKLAAGYTMEADTYIYVIYYPDGKILDVSWSLNRKTMLKDVESILKQFCSITAPKV
tara:strand:- start:78 stop:347 length:270 start_codon:yes stop_codon:yes gene_type:complete